MGKSICGLWGWKMLRSLKASPRFNQYFASMEALSEQRFFRFCTTPVFYFHVAERLLTKKLYISAHFLEARILQTFDLARKDNPGAASSQFLAQSIFSVCERCKHYYPLVKADILHEEQILARLCQRNDQRSGRELDVCLLCAAQELARLKDPHSHTDAPPSPHDA